MSNIAKYAAGSSVLLQGNVAIARGALEGGAQVCAGYPGTPSSEIIGTLAGVAKELGIHVEWSINEKVAAEVAAAAAFTGLRSLAAMKNAGLNVAMDFLMHLNLSSTGERGGALVVVVCDDPQAHSSGDEEDTRWVAQMASVPLLEPATIQEAKDMVRWAFELSEQFQCYCFVRSYTRLSHSRSSITLEKLPPLTRTPLFDRTRCYTPYIAPPKHAGLLEKQARVQEIFEKSPFNSYSGPEKPELLIICSGSGAYCSRDAIEALKLTDSVGVLKLGTLWPFPEKLVLRYLARTSRVLVVEEVDPFVETHVKEILVNPSAAAGTPEIYGKGSGHINYYGEITPDAVIKALSRIFKLEYQAREASYEEAVQEASGQLLIDRGMTWCPGCPHRASFFSLRDAIRKDGRNAIVTGDIGCYTLDVFPYGTHTTNVLHCMGSGTGTACGFGELAQLGLKQPVLAVCGDSTFFHASIPALINAVYNKSNMTLLVLDNGATAMTGFQPHPGTGRTATQEPTTAVDVEALCHSLGCRVEVSDPFNIKGTTALICELMKGGGGVKVLILRRKCELLRMRQEKRHPYRVWVDTEKCKGEKCGYCYKVLQCPGISWDKETGKARVQEALCAGCGVCADICPSKAIVKEEIK
ncbi:MAG: thiamine pyrophosphate-dependent enzyme [Chloroflexota bacterium]|nr:thiamine pyrophosphate-dependent enzyme [Chloroflexota bacterium]